MKRFLSIILTVAMLMTLLPTTLAFAESTNEAAYSTDGSSWTETATLADAVEALNDASVAGTIKLLKDITLTESLLADTDITIIADKDITVTVDNSEGNIYGDVILVTGSLTLGDSSMPGTITFDGASTTYGEFQDYFTDVIGVTGSFEMNEGITISGFKTESGAINYQYGTSCIINGGTVVDNKITYDSGANFENADIRVDLDGNITLGGANTRIGYICLDEGSYINVGDNTLDGNTNIFNIHSYWQGDNKKSYEGSADTTLVVCADAEDAATYAKNFKYLHYDETKGFIEKDEYTAIADGENIVIGQKNAAEPEVQYQLDGDSDWTDTTLVDAVATIGTGKGSIKVLKDIDTTAEIAIAGDVTLDLAGFTISGSGTHRIFNVTGAFTLDDSSGTNAGTITNGYHKASTTQYAVEGGGAIYLKSGSFVMNGGTLTNNKVESSNESSYLALGGALLCESDTTCDLNGGVFSNNSAVFGGGAIAADSSTLTANNVVFSGNKVTGTSSLENTLGVYHGGGAIFFMQSSSAESPVFERCEFDNNNSGSLHGGAIIALHTEISINSSKFTGNKTTSAYGGALRLYNGAGSITDSTFTSNSAVRGGAMHVGLGGNLSVSGCTITDNTATAIGGGIYTAVYGSTSPSLNVSNTKLHSNTANNFGADFAHGNANVSFTLPSEYTDSDGNGYNVKWYYDGYHNGNVGRYPTYNVEKTSLSNQTEVCGLKAVATEADYEVKYSTDDGSSWTGSTLTEAVTAIGTNTGIIKVLKDIELTASVTISGNITVIAGDADVTIKRASAFTSSAMFIVSNGAKLALGTETAMTNTLTIDGGAVWTDGYPKNQGYGKTNNTGVKVDGSIILNEGTFNIYDNVILQNNEIKSVSSSKHYSSGVSNYGTMNMYGGKIWKCGNSYQGENGGAVTVNCASSSGNSDTATFNMYGGEICYNVAFTGAGVCIGNPNYSDNDGSAYFNMYGGEIHNNIGGSNMVYAGGGVFVAAPKTGSTAEIEFNMYNGTIRSNTAIDGSYGYALGGGVGVHGTMNMSGGSITQNKAVNSSYTFSYGGGIAVIEDGILNITGGTVSNNTSTYADDIWINGYYEDSVLYTGVITVGSNPTIGEIYLTDTDSAGELNTIKVVSALNNSTPYVINGDTAVAGTTVVTFADGLNASDYVDKFTHETMALKVDEEHNTIILASPVVEYSITVDDAITHGTVTTSDDAAVEGTEITLTATPDDGYVFSAWDVTDADGNEVTVTDDKFSMPASNVTVSAIFEEEPTKLLLDFNFFRGSSYTSSSEKTISTINEQTAKNFGTIAITPKDKVVEEKSDNPYVDETVTYLLSNTEYTLTATPVDGATIEEIYITYSQGLNTKQVDGVISGDKKTGSITFTKEILAEVAQNQYATNIKVYVKFAMPRTLTVEVPSGDLMFHVGKTSTATGDGNITADGYAYDLGNGNHTINVGERVYIYGAGDDFINYKLIKTSTGEEIAQTPAAINWASYTLHDNPTHVGFLMPDYDVTVTYVKNESFTVDIAEDLNGIIKSVIYDKDENPTETNVYDLKSYSVDLVFTKSITKNVTALSIKNENSEDIGSWYLMDEDGAWVKNGSSYRFTAQEALDKLNELGAGTMSKPASEIAADITITATVENVPFAVTVADNIENGTVVVDKATAVEGETVSVTATPAASSTNIYELDEITVTDEGGNPVTVTEGKFTMPASNVTVSATFKDKLFNITYVYDTGLGTVTSQTTAKWKDVVYVSADLPDYHVISKATATFDSNSENVSIQKQSDGTWKVTMPAGNITVNLTFAKLTTSLSFDSTSDGHIYYSTGTAIREKANDQKVASVSYSEGFDPDSGKIDLGTSYTITVTPVDGYKVSDLWVKQMNSSTYKYEEIASWDGTTPSVSFTTEVANALKWYVILELDQMALTLTQPAEGGTITANGLSDTAQNVNIGSEVTLAQTANDEYDFVAWKVYKTGDETSTVTVTDNKFTMPAYAVTVTATYTKKTHAITTDAVVGGTITAPANAVVGSEVTASQTPDDKYNFQSWNVYKTGDETTIVAVTDGKFIMPNYPVTISANFVKKSHDITLIVKDNVGGSLVMDLTSPVTVGEVVTLTATPEAGYLLKSLVSDEVTISADNTFTMPNGVVTVTAEFEKIAYGISYSGDNVSFSENVSTSKWGETITFKAIADEHYTIESVAINGNTITAVEGVYSFTMPMEEVNVVVTTAKAKYAINTSTDASMGAINLIDATPAAWDETIHFTVAPEANYIVSDVKATNANGEIAISEDNGIYSFTMPKGNVTVTATFDKEIFAIATSGANVTFENVPTNSKWGENITIKATADQWFILENVTATGTTVTDNGDGTYTFVMPAQAITIVATATRAQHNVSFVSNGGSAVDGQVILNGEVAVKPDAPVRAGYAFAGWYKDNTFTQKYDFSTPVEGEITLYARWFMWGDVNLDGKVNGVDAMRIQQYMVGSVTTLEMPMAGHVNGLRSGKPTGVDAMRIQQYLVKTITSFPVETSAAGYEFDIENNTYYAPDNQ